MTLDAARAEVWYRIGKLIAAGAARYGENEITERERALDAALDALIAAARASGGEGHAPDVSRYVTSRCYGCKQRNIAIFASQDALYVCGGCARYEKDCTCSTPSPDAGVVGEMREAFGAVNHLLEEIVSDHHAAKHPRDMDEPSWMLCPARLCVKAAELLLATNMIAARYDAAYASTTAEGEER